MLISLLTKTWLFHAVTAIVLLALTVISQMRQKIQTSSPDSPSHHQLDNRWVQLVWQVWSLPLFFSRNLPGGDNERKKKVELLFCSKSGKIKTRLNFFWYWDSITLMIMYSCLSFTEEEHQSSTISVLVASAMNSALIYIDSTVVHLKYSVQHIKNILILCSVV